MQTCSSFLASVARSATRLSILAAAAFGPAIVAVPAHAASIAYWNCGDNHPTQVATALSELASSLGAGSVVSPFCTSSEGAFESTLASSDILFMPQTGFAALLSGAVRSEIQEFVAGGGRFIGLWETGNGTLGIINTILGSTIQAMYAGFGTGGYSTPIARTAAATGTSFESGPATIAPLNDMVGLVTATLPGNAVSLYEGTYLGTPLTHVMTAGYGSGSVTYLAWDWCCGDTPSQRDQWDAVLYAAATYTPSNGVPAPGSLALIGLGLAGFGLSRRILGRRGRLGG